MNMLVDILILHRVARLRYYGAISPLSPRYLEYPSVALARNSQRCNSESSNAQISMKGNMSPSTFLTSSKYKSSWILYN